MSTTASRWKLHCEYLHENEFVHGKSDGNGIENFWSFAKGWLAKFNGCASDKFMLSLKECALATKFQAMAVQSQLRRFACPG
ncbi:MAG: hypothetical protein K2M50_08165 [Treponemataceae bacterium]|nr:hypothetical protein [Treponemataceae bacterium]